ncbi:MAG: protein kinase [Phycisphaerales bacterium]|nr:protein kinase [Phycisphaerales bacterium]MCB9856152.1 protein kinase [Phycisphaerales bacterium]
MKRHEHNAPDETNTHLDAGLRAAFGPGPDDASSEWNDSVVATIDHNLGIHSRISLKDDSDGCGPMFRPQSDELQDGEGRIGRYQLAGEIARGGVGVVLRGRDADLGRDVAIKMLRGRYAASPAMVQRFMEEAQITGQLQHPGILPVYELGLRSGDRPYFAMKLVKGRTLATLLRERRNANDDRRRFLSVFEHICQTMAYAHTRGVVHRDLKPSNIMVGPFGEVQVVDWGLAKVLSRGAAGDDSSRGADPIADSVVETLRSTDDGSQSVAGAVMGTPAYMSPEQARGEVDRIDERSDVFALGAILFEILTGRAVYDGSGNDVLRRAADGDLTTALQALNACDADPELKSIAMACLSADPESRPHSASIVAQDVASYLAGLEDKVHAAEIAAAEAEVRAKAAKRSRRLTLALAASVLFAMLLIGGGIVWRDQVIQQRIDEGTQLVSAALERAATALGEAKASPVSDDATWEAALAAGDQVERLIFQRLVDEDTVQRANVFLDELRSSDADRRLLALTDDIVSRGATHSDVDSWKVMDDDYIEAFKNAGIDVLTASDEEIANWIRSSEHPEQLANAFELWLWTGEDLKHRFGVDRYARSLRERARPIFLADTDSFRTRLRDQMYRLQPEGNTIDVNVLRELAANPAFETAPATSLSWLGTCFFSAKEPDPQGGMDVYRRAVALYPDDFLLNNDYARMLELTGRDAEASRIYSRCVAIRRNVSGAWRALGVTLRRLNELQEAVDAIEQSIRLQPDHMPTYIDLWLTLVAAGDMAKATEALHRASTVLDAPLDLHVMLMRALPDRSPMTRSGMLEQAIGVLKNAKQRMAGDMSAESLLDDWIHACERAIEYREATLPEVPAWAQPADADE